MTELRLTRYSDVLDAFRQRDLRQALYDEGGVVMDDVLLTLHGEPHTKRRKLENRLFRREVFREIEHDLVPQLIAEASAPDLERGGADLVDLGYRITMNLTAEFAGLDRPDKTPAETEQLLALVRTFSEGATLVHSARDKDEVRSEVRDALDLLDARFLEPSMERRKGLLDRLAAGEIDEAQLPNDVLTVLLRNVDDLHLPRDVIRREMAFYLQAGSHSTANSTTHAMHEIFAWCGNDAARWQRLEESRLFVQRCVHESIRLHPASPVSWRKPVCPVHITDRSHGEEERSHPADPDDMVVMDMMSANRDPSVFGSDADLFDPDRRLPDSVLPFGISFGRGAHACIGQDLDAGFVAKPGADPDTHLYGVVTVLVLQLLDWGARPDPSDPPVADPKTQRTNWGRYPVVFTALETGRARRSSLASASASNRDGEST